MSTEKKKQLNLGVINQILNKASLIVDKMNTNIDSSQTPIEKKDNEISNKNITPNSIDKIDLLEYSINNRNIEENSNYIEEEDNVVRLSDSIDLKKYKNFSIKFSKVSFIQTFNSTLSTLFYLECKIPTMRSKGGEMLYDEFKIYFQNEDNKPSVDINKISIHSLNLENQSFSAIANSKIILTLHVKTSSLDKKTQQKTTDSIVGNGSLEFNHVFLSKKFKYNGEILLTNKIKVKQSGKKQQQKETLKETTVDVAKVEMSCILSKENDEQNESLNGYEKQNAGINKVTDTVNINNTNEVVIQSGILQEQMNSESVEEIKTDLFDDILVIYMQISDLSITNITSEKNHNKNYFIMHKGFPSSTILTSDIMWNNAQPNFNYTCQMPFTLNQTTAEMLDNNLFIVELWNKADNDDELIGIIRFEMRKFLDILKIDTDTITVVQLYRNVYPYIVYKDKFPVDMFNESVEGGIFLSVQMAIGSPMQINTYIRDQSTSKTKEIIFSGSANKENIKDISIVKVRETGVNVAEESLDPFREDDNKEKQIENENQSLNNNNEEDTSKANEINIDEMFEKNKKELEKINTNYKINPSVINPMSNNPEFKATTSSKVDINKEEIVNPFLVPQSDEKEFTNTMTNKAKETGTAGFKVSNENFFSIGENFYKEQPKQIQKEKDNEPLWHSESNVHFVNTNTLKNSTSSLKPPFAMKIEDTSSNVIDNRFSDTNQLSKSLNANSNNLKLIPEKEEQSSVSPISPKSTSMPKDKIIKYTFTISIDKIINCKVLSLIQNPFIRYQFFKDEAPLRSENLSYSLYKEESSIIDVDMKSSHSLLLTPTDSINKYLSDFAIEILYRDGDENVIVGNVNIPSDAIMNSSSENSIKTFSEFIRGTDKINRNGCIIGKITFSISLNISEENVSLKNFSNGEIFIEKETIFNRKIPKNANLIINIGNFTSLNLFEEYYRKNFSFYFIVSPFGEIPSMEKKYGKRLSSKKHNVLSAFFGEALSFRLELDQDIVNYFKCRNCLIYLIYKTSSLSEEENDFSELTDGKNVIGKGYLSLSEILTTADQKRKNVLIKQIGNESGSLGELTCDISLQNANEDIKNTMSLTSTFNKGTGLNFNPNLYLNGRFFFVINFAKLLFDANTVLSTQLSNEFYFVFKLGKNLKKVTPKFPYSDNNLYQLTNSINMFLLNHAEFFDLNLNFAKKIPNDLYNQFNESVLEIKLYQNEVDSLGSFYIDIHKLITSDFYSENILFSGSNIINLIETKSNKSKNAKLQIDLTLMKICDDIPDEYLKLLFSNEFSSHLLSIKPNEVNIDDIKKNINSFASIDLSSFISDNVIDIDTSSSAVNNYKKLFTLSTKLNFDILAYYAENTALLSKAQNDFNTTNIFNKNEDDINMLNYLKDQNSIVNIGVNVQSITTKIDSISYAIFLSSYQNAVNITNNIALNDANMNEQNDISDNEDVAMKKMIIDVYSGMNIVLPNSSLTSRPNCFFVLEFDDKTYKSDIIAKTSQPAWNEELEIKICETDYINKINSLPIIISVFSSESNGDVLIGKGEIFPCKLFPFLNKDNEVEDFYHISNENGNVMGQLNVKVKFEGDVGNTVGKTGFVETDWKKSKYKTEYIIQEDDEETLKKKLEEAMNTVSNLTLELQKTNNNI